jgi:hypothetical protein
LKKIKENANFRNSADDILADDKFPSMQRVKGAGDIFLPKFQVPKGSKQSNPFHQNRK